MLLLLSLLLEVLRWNGSNQTVIGNYLKQRECSNTKIFISEPGVIGLICAFYRYMLLFVGAVETQQQSVYVNERCKQIHNFAFPWDRLSQLTKEQRKKIPKIDWRKNQTIILTYHLNTSTKNLKKKSLKRKKHCKESKWIKLLSRYDISVHIYIYTMQFLCVCMCGCFISIIICNNNL